MNKKLVILWSVLAGVFALLLIAMCIGSPIADHYSSQLNSFFNIVPYERIEDEFAAEQDSQYYKPKFSRLASDSEKEEMRENNQPVFNYIADKDALYENDKLEMRKVAADGAVLLWNENGALPLTNKSETINFYGGRSVNWCYVTDGSGGTRMSEHPTIRTAFEELGYTVNGSLWSWYQGHSYGTGTGGVNETPWDAQIEDSTSGGVGIYVISRKGSEGSDLAMTGSDGANGNLTALSAAEVDHLNNLVRMKREGKLSRVIVLLNTVSMGVQFDVLSTYEGDVDACVWVGLGGTSGPAAAADVVTGEVVPSGKLADTFVYDSMSAPSTENNGDFEYTGQDKYSGNAVYEKLKRAQGTGDSTEKNLKYLVYQEGIYVGYRYYETRYADLVCDLGNADGTAGSTDGGAWDYSSEVAYPFGYGMSYTTFGYSGFDVRRDGDDYVATLTVTNTGSEYSGRESVQIYLSKPYGEYENTNGVEQSAIDLVGFAKTGEIAPGGHETVTVTIDGDELLTYDANAAKTYITCDGDYIFATGSDAHEAMNNILAAKGKTGDAAGNADMTKTFGIRGNYEQYESRYTGNAVTNRFDDVDLNKAGYGTGEVKYLSRSDWQGTYPSKVDVPLTDSLLSALDYEKTWEEDEFAVVPEYGKENGLNLFSLWKDTDGNEIPYDHPLWEDLLDQTTFEEQAYLICNAWCATQPLDSVSAPGTENRDGPAGLNYLPAPSVIGLGMCYPSENLLASSFDVENARIMGECLGEDNLACGFTFLYAPNANLHRNAFGGRNGESYSEDGFLSGMMCEYEVKGLQSNGAGAQIKHYALNDMEVNRNGVAIWANEQSIRELYLKAFEGGCAEGRGESLSVMSSFTRAGALWAGAHKGMMTDVLRDEWGFVGFVQSDGNGYALMSNYVDGLRVGQDIFMCGGGRHALDDYKDSPTITLAMREATHRVLYALVRTNAMNGMTSSTRIVTLTPWWRHAITGLIIGFAVCTAAAAGMLVFTIVRGVMKKKNSEAAPAAETGDKGVK